jgi:phthalate 4,5-cis-dihydrodiol dehydrogenase
MTELRVGVAGLGAASAQILPCLRDVPGVRLTAAADVRPEARDAFAAAYRLPAYETVEAMCASPDVDLVWIATPNTLHCEHTLAAARAGKHVICEKPMALTLEECDRMIAEARRAGVQLLQGHSKIFDSPVRAMRAVVESGRIGKVVQIDSWNFNDWLQRPRIASEVDTRMGGGVVFRQGPHQVDIVRYIAGVPARSVRGIVGRWDPHFATEGNFSALIEFEGGAAASLTLNGYGYFDVTELAWGIGEGGNQVEEPRKRKPRTRATGPMQAAEKYDYLAKAAQGGHLYPQGTRQPFYGVTTVSCERGAIRQSPDGLYLYTEAGCEELPVERNAGRSAELIEFKDALAAKRRVFPDGIWGRGTLEICLGILESSGAHRDVPLLRQGSEP